MGPTPRRPGGAGRGKDAMSRGLGINIKREEKEAMSGDRNVS